MRSMTGYGRRLVSRDGREMTVEIKTVNHRFLDVSLRMPRALSFAEEAVLCSCSWLCYFKFNTSFAKDI